MVKIIKWKFKKLKKKIEIVYLLQIGNEINEFEDKSIEMIPPKEEKP